MIKLNSLVLILSLSSPFVTMAKDTSIYDQSNVYDKEGQTYTVRIAVPKAIVYADENMLIPLGYITQGKTITVGNPRRINKALVPMILYGKIAYIEIENINYEKESDEDYFSKRGAPKEHNIDLILPKVPEDLTKNNYLFLGLHQFGAGKQFKETMMNIDGSDKSSFSGFEISAIHRMSDSRFFWGLGFEYNAMSTESFKLNFFTFNPTMGYNLYRHKYFLVDLVGSLDFSIASDMRMSQFDLRETGALIWGPQLNARVTLFPSRKYQLYGSLGMRNYSVSKLDNLRNTNNLAIDGLSKIQGINMNIGVVFDFR